MFSEYVQEPHKLGITAQCRRPFALEMLQQIIRITNGPSLSVVLLFQVAKAVSHSLNNCVNCLPGQKDVDMALRSIGEASKKLLVDMVSPIYSLNSAYA